MYWLLNAESGLRLRRLTAGDVDATAELAGRAFNSPGITREVKEMLQTYCDTGAFQVPLERQSGTMLPVSYYLLVQNEPAEEKRLGLSGLYRPVWAGQGVYWLGWFAVDPEFHGQGYGARLLQATLTLAAAKGGRLLCVETSQELDAARRLYRQAGFEQYGQVPDYWAPGSSLVILARRLDDIHMPQGVPDEL